MKEIQNTVLSRNKEAARRGGLNGEEDGVKEGMWRGTTTPMPSRKLEKALLYLFSKIYISMKGIFKESPYKGGDNVPTRHYMLPNKTLSTRNDFTF